MNLPRTLGELKKSSFSEQRLRTRRVKDELRENLIKRLRGSQNPADAIDHRQLLACAVQAIERMLQHMHDQRQTLRAMGVDPLPQFRTT